MHSAIILSVQVHLEQVDAVTDTRPRMHRNVQERVSCPRHQKRKQASSSRHFELRARRIFSPILLDEFNNTIFFWSGSKAAPFSLLYPSLKDTPTRPHTHARTHTNMLRQTCTQHKHKDKHEHMRARNLKYTITHAGAGAGTHIPNCNPNHKRAREQTTPVAQQRFHRCCLKGTPSGEKKVVW